MPVQPGILISAILLILCLGINLASYPEVAGMLRRDSREVVSQPDTATESEKLQVSRRNRPIPPDGQPVIAEPSPITETAEPLSEVPTAETVFSFPPVPVAEPLPKPEPVIEATKPTELPSVFHEREPEPIQRPKSDPSAFLPIIPSRLQDKQAPPASPSTTREQPAPPYAAPFTPLPTTKEPPVPSPTGKVQPSSSGPIWETVETALERPVMVESPPSSIWNTDVDPR